MSNQYKLKKIIGLGIFLLPILSFSATSTVTNTNEVTKDAWLEQIKKMIVVPICKSFMDDPSISARLKERNISYDDCQRIIPSLADSCQKKYYDDMPAQINNESAKKWWHKLGECIGGDFVIHHLYPEAKVTPKKS